MKNKIEKIPHYGLEISLCEDCKISEYGSMKYLSLTLKHQSGGTQGIPAFNAPNIKVTEKYLCDTFNLEKIEDLKNKTIWSISGFSEVFALVNPENKKMFNLKSRYMSDSFLEDINEHKKLDYYQNLNLDSTDIINFISLNESIKRLDVENPVLKEIHDDVKKYLLFVSLDSSLGDKKYFAPKMKI